MEYLKWSDMMYFYFDVLECQMDRISRKYKYGIINNNSCPEAYSIANDSTLTIEERIENLTCMIEDLVKSYIHEFPDIEQNKIILDWKRDIDSLRSLPICRH